MGTCPVTEAPAVSRFGRHVSVLRLCARALDWLRHASKKRDENTQYGDTTDALG